MQLRHLDNTKKAQFQIVVHYKSGAYVYYRASRYRRVDSIIEYFSRRIDFVYLSIFLINKESIRLRRVYYHSSTGVSKVCS